MLSGGEKSEGGSRSARRGVRKGKDPKKKKTPLQNQKKAQRRARGSSPKEGAVSTVGVNGASGRGEDPKRQKPTTFTVK